MTYKQQVIDLWQACFNDPEAFVHLYFSTKYSEENTVVHVEGDKVLSALQMLPYSMTCWGRELLTSYISGASTWPEVRGRGLMTGLLKKAFDIMRSRNVQVSTLIPAEPWLFNFYKRVGYGTVFYSSMQTYKDVPFKQCQKTEHHYSEEELYAYFMISMQNRPCCVQHSFSDFQTIIADIRLSGGRVFVVPLDKRYIGGIALVVPDSGKIWIKEWMYDNEEIRMTLLSDIKTVYPYDEIVFKAPASSENGVAYGMMRIIDAPITLQYYAAAYPAINVVFSLIDEQVPSNTATYILDKGKCEKKNFRSDNVDFIFSPSELVEKIFHDKSYPCMTLMLN